MGLGVGAAVGVGVGLGVGAAVGVGVGLGVGAAVGVGAGCAWHAKQEPVTFGCPPPGAGGTQAPQLGIAWAVEASDHSASTGTASNMARPETMLDAGLPLMNEAVPSATDFLFSSTEFLLSNLLVVVPEDLRHWPHGGRQ